MPEATHSPEVEEVIAAIQTFYALGPDRANHDKLLAALCRMTPETIANVPTHFKDRIQEQIWEHTSFPRHVWYRKRWNPNDGYHGVSNG